VRHELDPGRVRLRPQATHEILVRIARVELDDVPDDRARPERLLAQPLQEETLLGRETFLRCEVLDQLARQPGLARAWRALQDDAGVGVQVRGEPAHVLGRRSRGRRFRWSAGFHGLELRREGAVQVLEYRTFGRISETGELPDGVTQLHQQGVGVRPLDLRALLLPHEGDPGLVPVRLDLEPLGPVGLRVNPKRLDRPADTGGIEDLSPG